MNVLSNSIFNTHTRTNHSDLPVDDLCAHGFATGLEIVNDLLLMCEKDRYTTTDNCTKSILNSNLNPSHSFFIEIDLNRNRKEAKELKENIHVTHESPRYIVLYGTSKYPGYKKNKVSLANCHLQGI